MVSINSKILTLTSEFSLYKNEIKKLGTNLKGWTVLKHRKFEP